ncbi:MAG TPA: hypothetical protein VIL33_05025, partial [Rhodothermia bacterium]
SYTNEENETPNVSFTYDSGYNRLKTMVDGTGTTTYSYHPTRASPPLGAGRLSSVDGPLANDAIAYGYDELGRVASRAIDGVALSYAYDALGRIQGETNALGAFSYEYDGVTSRLRKVTYPNGQTSSYAYYPNSGDHRLQKIHHRKPVERRCRGSPIPTMRWGTPRRGISSRTRTRRRRMTSNTIGRTS